MGLPVATPQPLVSALAQTYLPVGWWDTKAFQIDGEQAATGDGSYYTQITLAAMRTRYGAGYPAADVHYVATAPYVTPTLGASDSVPTILSEFNAEIISDANPPNGLPGQDSEAIDALVIYFGLKGMATYEGGGQWNSVNGGNPDGIANLGPALLSVHGRPHFVQAFAL
jgi:hypothetical protein